MKTLLVLALAASLSACATANDPCAGSAKRRSLYTATITAADLAVATGHGSPAVTLGRQAAVTALGLLDARCPVAR